MRLLIDTHVLIWMRREPERLSQRVATLLKDAEQDICVSAATAWEIATKVQSGKLAFDASFLDRFDDVVRTLAFEPLSITTQHAIAGARLPGSHKDPFDRILAGQSVIEGLTLVSADPAFKMLGIDALW